MWDEIAVKMGEVIKILKGFSYNPEEISPKEFYEYMTGETPTGDIITLEDVLRNEFLMVHEVVEISELKKMGVPINKQTVVRFYPKVYEAHLTALDYELTHAINEGNYEWLKPRFKNFEAQLNDPFLPPEFKYLKQKLAPKVKHLEKKFLKYLKNV
jgi:hypothetical protein